MNAKTKAGLNLLLFFVTIAVNALGAFGLINGLSQKEVSDTFPTLLTPSPFTFSIWSVIYVLLLISLIYMLVKSGDRETARLIDQISVPFWISSVANILWIVTFSLLWIGISTLLILILTISLAVINRRLWAPEGIGQKVNALAFGLYNGWLIVATVVNVSAFLVQINWNRFGLGESVWGLIILIVALLLTSLIQTQLRNAALTLPLAWAYFGIWQAHRAGGLYNGLYPNIEIATLIIGAIYVIIAVYVFITNGNCVLPKGASRKRSAA